MPTKSPATAIYQLKITLKDFRPPIWRRVLVPDNFTLAALDVVIQISMGWTNSHLHDFTIRGERFSEPSPDDWEPVKDERKYRLGEVLPREKSKLVYQYDFGDSWRHDVVVEKILPVELGQTYPVCISGKRSGPPEDVGGVWGYANFLEAITNPEHPEHTSYVEWIGGEFDPGLFDLDEVNKMLRSVKW
jgi:hypothetical protein